MSATPPGLVDSFARDGYAIMPEALPPAVCEDICGHLSGVIASAAAEPDPGFWPGFAASAHATRVLWDDRAHAGPLGEPRVMRVGHALHADGGAFEAFCRQPAIVDSLRDVLGGAGRFVSSAIVYKQPQSDLVQFGWHQDSWYLPARPDALALAFIALDDLTRENGCLQVLPGSHLAGRTTTLVLREQGGFSPRAGLRDPGPIDDRSARILEVPRGSIVLVHGLTLHASGPNRSPRPRRTFIVHALGEGATLEADAWLQPPAGGFRPLH